MFRIKICGIRSRDDALAAVAAGADAVGLNFYEQSPRYCPLDQAEEIASSLPANVRRVGLFVNARPEHILETSAWLKLDLIQLHGDEPPEFLAELHGRPVMRAFRVADGLQPVHDYLASCHTLRCLPRMALLDTQVAGQYGGTGKALDWLSIATQRPLLAGVPLVLAGGLTADNVAAAIKTARPWAVDTASGVETEPGKKSSEKMQAFVAAAKSAF